MKNKEYTKEEIMKVFKEIFNRPQKQNHKIGLHKFGWLHNTWEEGGNYYSSWTWKSADGLSFTTGDGGKLEFDKIFKEQLEKEWNKK